VFVCVCVCVCVNECVCVCLISLTLDNPKAAKYQPAYEATAGYLNPKP